MIGHPPCKGCHKRHAGCHAQCMHYISWKKKSDEHNARVSAEKEAEGIYLDYIFRAKARYGKKLIEI